MPKVKIGQVCIGNKNPATFDIGDVAVKPVRNTPVRPRRWDGRFSLVPGSGKQKFQCTMEGPADHCGIGKVPTAIPNFAPACQIDGNGTTITLKGNVWTLTINGFDSKGNTFHIWVGTNTLTPGKKKSVLGDYSNTGIGTDTKTTLISIVAK